MSQTIRSLFQLRSALDKHCYYALDKTAQLIKEKIEEFIREYYREYTGADMPVLYKRTWQFLNSVVKANPVKTANGYQINIYIDMSLSYDNGWTMAGTAIQANKAWHGWYKAVQVGNATHFWDDSLEEVPIIIAKSFGDFLKSKGLNICFT